MLFLKYTEARRRTSSRQPESLAATISCVHHSPGYWSEFIVQEKQKSQVAQKKRNPSRQEGMLKLQEGKSRIPGGSRTGRGRIPPACGPTRRGSEHWKGASTRSGRRPPREPFVSRNYMNATHSSYESGNGDRGFSISWRRSADVFASEAERQDEVTMNEKGRKMWRATQAFYLFIILFYYYYFGSAFDF